jgi:PAS domain S-box-containing protein
MREQKIIHDNLMKDLILVDERLRKTNEELEAKVLERTSELQRLNEELKREVEIRMKAEEGLKKREHLLSVAFDTSFLWTGLLDPDGRLLLANKQSLDFLNLKRQDVIGKYFWETPWWEHSPKQKEKVRKALREAKKGTAAKFDVYHIDKEGTRQEVQFSIRPVKNESGEIIFLIPEGVNITERKDHERSLEKARDEFRSLLENTRDMYVSFDKEGTLTYIGPQVRRFGHDPEEIIGKNLSVLMPMLHPDDLKESETAFMKRFMEQDESPRSYRFLGPHKEIYWVEETVKIIKDESGNLLRMNVIIRDITERKKVEEELLKLNEVLKLINKIMRHDISNRLLVAHGNIGLMMEEGTFDPEKIRVLENAIRSSIELTKRMADLEKLVHSSDGMKEFELEQTIHDIFEEFPIEHTVIGNATIMADDALISVFTNLISNAISHGNAKKMEFRIEEENDSCIITIHNDGTPIPKGAREMVFDESFSFGDRRGSGLGLFISKRLIERYGGSLELVDTDVDETVFRICLPSKSG